MADACDVVARYGARAIFGGPVLPELVRMQPAGRYFLYDPLRIWEPLGEEKSRHFASLGADDYVRLLDKAVKRAALGAQIDFDPLPLRLAQSEIHASVWGNKPKKKREISPADDRRRENIRAIAAAGYIGRQYCIELDNRGVKPPPKWNVGTYKQAYDDINYLRARVQDEKHRLTKKSKK
jgi:hypothetical protein